MGDELELELVEIYPTMNCKVFRKLFSSNGGFVLERINEKGEKEQHNMVGNNFHNIYEVLNAKQKTEK